MGMLHGILAPIPDVEAKRSKYYPQFRCVQVEPGNKVAGLNMAPLLQNQSSMAPRQRHAGIFASLREGRRADADGAFLPYLLYLLLVARRVFYSEILKG